MKKILICFYFLILSVDSYAQNNVNVGLGSATYLGELNPYNIPIHSFLGSSTRWNVGLGYNKQIRSNFQLSTGFSFIRLFGDDNSISPRNEKRELFYLRNLHFRNDLKEYHLSAKYLFGNNRSFTQNSTFYRPFISIGMAIFNHNPKAKEPLVDVIAKTDWISVREERTEGQTTPYMNWGVAFPITVGLQKRLNRNVGLQVELSYRFTFFDYLDDVSTNYSNTSSLFTNRSAEILGAHSKKDRSTWLLEYVSDLGYATKYPNQIPKEFRDGVPPFDVDGANRGNPKVNDSYFTTRISFIYFFKEKTKCPNLN